MACYKGYDYTQAGRIPVSLDNQLLTGTLEFTIQALVGRCQLVEYNVNLRQRNRRTDSPRVLCGQGWSGDLSPDMEAFS